MTRISCPCTLEDLGFIDENIWQRKLQTFAHTDATAKKLGVKIPDHLRVVPATNETTVCRDDDPAPAVTKPLAIEQFRAALAALKQACSIRQPPKGTPKMNEIVHRHTALPANFGESLMRGIADTRAPCMTGDGGKLLLRLLKNGTFVIGQNNEPVENGSEWAVNIACLARGWVCWGDGELLGQVMASVQSRAAAAAGAGQRRLLRGAVLAGADLHLRREGGPRGDLQEQLARLQEGLRQAARRHRAALGHRQGVFLAGRDPGPVQLPPQEIRPDLQAASSSSWAGPTRTAPSRRTTKRSRRGTRAASGECCQTGQGSAAHHAAPERLRGRRPGADRRRPMSDSAAGQPPGSANCRRHHARCRRNIFLQKFQTCIFARETTWPTIARMGRLLPSTTSVSSISKPGRRPTSRPAPTATPVDADAIVLAYAIGDGPVQAVAVADFSAPLQVEDLPRDLLEHTRRVQRGEAIFAAWNAGFDRAIWNFATIGFPEMEPHHIIDVMAQATASGLPPDLNYAPDFPAPPTRSPTAKR